MVRGFNPIPLRAVPAHRRGACRRDTREVALQPSARCRRNSRGDVGASGAAPARLARGASTLGTGPTRPGKGCRHSLRGKGAAGTSGLSIPPQRSRRRTPRASIPRLLASRPRHGALTPPAAQSVGRAAPGAKPALSACRRPPSRRDPGTQPGPSPIGRSTLPKECAGPADSPAEMPRGCRPVRPDRGPRGRGSDPAPPGEVPGFAGSAGNRSFSRSITRSSCSTINRHRSENSRGMEPRCSKTSMRTG